MTKMITINLKTVGLILAGLGVMYFFILVCTPKPQLPQEVKAQLDSLKKLTIQLEANQVKYDSVITAQSDIIEEIDDHVNRIKEKTTVIREYYHEQSQAASLYTPTQIDSFFKKRYGY